MTNEEAKAVIKIAPRVEAYIHVAADSGVWHRISKATAYSLINCFHGYEIDVLIRPDGTVRIG